MSEAMKTAPMSTAKQFAASTPTQKPAKATYAAGILSSTKEYRVDPMLIDVKPGHNVRFDFGDIDVLAESIKDQHMKDGVGVLVALNVKRAGERFELVSGERRLKAVHQLITAGVEFTQGIPVKIVDKNLTETELLILDFNSNSNKPLLPLEEAAGFQRLSAAGMTQAQIAKETGRGQYHVHASLKLLLADPDVINAVQTGELNASLARDIATKVDSKEEQRALAAEVKAAGKDKKKLAAVKKSVKGKVRESQERRAASKGKELKMRALSDVQLSELGTKVNGYLEALIKDTGTKSNDALLNQCASDNMLAAAFTLGALQALKAAAGLKINLKL